MASPNSSPSSVPPTSADISPPPPPSSPSPTNSSVTSPSPTSSQPSQTSDTPAPTSSDPANPPPSPPQAISATPPPSLSLSPPPPSTLPPTSPPPSPPASPPPTPPASPPPSPTALVSPTPPASPPPSPTTSAPPTATTAPPPTGTSPPPPNVSPPPPVADSPPPQASESEAPPAAIPPPSQHISPSPPPPANIPTPPSSSSPPPPPGKPPENTPSLTPPPSVSQSASPPSTKFPPRSTLLPPPPSVPSASSPPPIFLPTPATNSSAAGAPPEHLPSIPTEKPTAKSTDGTDITTNSPPSHPGGLNTGGAVAIGIVVGFVVLGLVMAMWFVQKRKRKEKGSKVGYAMPSPFASSQNSGTLFLRPQSLAPFFGSGSGSDFMYSPSEPGGVSNSRSSFSYEELVQATNGFSALNLLGEGGFGCVFKGLLTDGREVAVKQLKVGGGQGEREFRAEVEIISRVHHRHLVSLVGYCISEHQRLLVYDYVPNNTLHYHLHGKDRPVMDWATRVKVAAGAARGIAYLHEDCHPRIIHRDIKSSNILLDKNFEAQVSDFGLAKLALDTYTHVTTRVMGTFGYLAPEYATSGKLTEKSDVYSFGVVLLELITGRKPVDASQPIGDESLVEWARPLLTQALDNEDFEILVDPRLEKNYNRNEMFRMMEAAAACVRHSGAKRPRMSQVVRALDSVDELPDLNNGMKPGQSSVFDSAQQSAQIRMFRRMAFGSQDYSTSYFNDSQTSWSREQEDPSTISPQNRSGPWNV